MKNLLVGLFWSVMFMGSALSAVQFFSSCERKLQYDGFDSSRFFSLYELYQKETFRSLDEALENPDSVFKLVLFRKTLSEVSDEVYCL